MQAPAALLRSALDAAIAAAQPAICVPPHLPPAPDGGRVFVVGAGKAAAAMAQATHQHYTAAGFGDRVSGAVVTRKGAAAGFTAGGIDILEASHPVPDAASAAAARRLLDVAGSAGPNDLVVCLLSGGGSALAAAPVEGVTLADKQDLTRALLRCGASIDEINCVRKHLSAFKGGRLALAADPAQVVTLAISDVPGDDPSVIASGPTVADATTLADARAQLVRYGIDVPPAVAAALGDLANETPKPGDAALRATDYRLIAAPALSLAAAAQVLEAGGCTVLGLGDQIEGEARVVGAEHASKALAIAADRPSPPVAILSGGELTVTMRGDGAGGPNREYLLALAIGLEGAPGIHALAADTDGADGRGNAAGDVAGAQVGPDTLTAARETGLSASECLDRNDSGGFFDALGAAIVTGPTQTNVNDLRIVLVSGK